jgi:hypothetical protein
MEKNITVHILGILQLVNGYYFKELKCVCEGGVGGGECGQLGVGEGGDRGIG